MDSIGDISPNSSQVRRDEVDKIHSELVILKGEITRLLELMTPPTTKRNTASGNVVPEGITSPRSDTRSKSSEDIPNGQRAPEGKPTQINTASYGIFTSSQKMGQLNLSTMSGDVSEDVYLFSGAKPKRIQPSRTYSTAVGSKSVVQKDTRQQGRRQLSDTDNGMSNYNVFNLDNFFKNAL